MTQRSENRFALGSRVRFRRVDHEGVFVLQESGEVLVVNDTGAKVVELLSQGHDVQSVAYEIASVYSLDVDVAHRDVRNIINDLVQAQALQGVAQ